MEINKWYIGIEILKCPPTMRDVFKPYFFVMFMKYIDFGDFHIRPDGRPAKVKGGWKMWSFPIGIEIRIIR